MAALLFKLALLLVPAEWRGTVRADVVDDARARRRGAGWMTWQVARIAVRLRWTVTGDSVMSDLRYAIRSLVRHRWFTIGAMLTFAVGIGINLAIFAVVDRALFRPLPFREPDRLVTIFPISVTSGQRTAGMSKAIAVEAARDRTGVEDLAFVGNGEAYSLAGQPQTFLRLNSASYNALDVLGVAPVIGRVFTRADLQAGAPVAMITYDVWRGRFGGSPDAVGQRLMYYTGTQSAEIVGVLPQEFIAPSVSWSADANGLVLSMDFKSLEVAEPRSGVPAPFARLRPGATARQVQQQFDAAIVRVTPDTLPEKRPHVVVEPIQQGVFWWYRRQLQLLFAGASLVWLLGSANLGALLLARGRARTSELAVRASLGASTARLVVTSMLESLLVCSMGATTALVTLVWALGALRTFVPGFFRPIVVSSIDLRLIVLTLIGAGVGTLIAGMYPAWLASRASVSRLLRSDARTGRRLRTGRALITVQAAVGTLLVLAAALTIRSLVGLRQVDMGFEPERLYTVRASTGPRLPDVGARFARSMQVRELLVTQPGVAGITAADWYPSAREVLDRIKDEHGHETIVRSVLENYFGVLDTPILAGRTFSEAERLTNAPVAMLSRGAAARCWPDLPPSAVIGRSLRLGDETAARVIVGITTDTRSRAKAATVPEVFLPAQPGNPYGMMLLLRASSEVRPDNTVLAQALRRQFGEDATVTLSAVSDATEYDYQDPVLYAEIFGAFAVVALLLSGIGLFALTSGGVTERSYEIGVRVALGATAQNIRQMVVRQAVAPVAAGIVIGAIGAYWAGALMQSLLFQTDPRDPWTFAAVALVLIAAAALAAWSPARRAGRVDPVTALRAQ